MASPKRQAPRSRIPFAHRLSRIDYRRLLYLKEAAAAGTIRGAAERLGTSASALSRHIIKMEADLQMALLERHGRGVRATEAGHVLVQYFLDHQSRLDAVVSQLQDMAEMRRGTVSLALGEGFSAEIMGDPLRSFAERYPNLTIDLHLGSTDELVRQILEDKAHVALLYNLPNEPRVQSHSACPYPIRVVTSPGHPLAMLGRPIVAADLLGHSLGLHPGGYGVRQVVLSAEHRSRLRLTPRLSTNALGPLLRFALEWNGVLLTPTFPVAQELAEGRLVAMKVQDGLLENASVHLITRRGRRLPAAAAYLLRHLLTTLAVLKPQD